MTVFRARSNFRTAAAAAAGVYSTLHGCHVAATMVIAINEINAYLKEPDRRIN